MVPQLGEGSRATASEARNTTAAAAAPNKAHSHVAKVGCQEQANRSEGVLRGQLGNIMSCAVQRPNSDPARHGRHSKGAHDVTPAPHYQRDQGQPPCCRCAE